MTRPSPDSASPYTRGDIARMTGASAPQVKTLGKDVLKKRARGTGNHLGFSLDDAVRIAVARELLRVGVQVGSIQALFDAIETPKVAGAKGWAWLRTPECKAQGAALVMVMPHPLAPSHTGAAYLTSAAEAVALLQQSKRTVIVIDVGALILQIEQHAGREYTIATAEDPHGRNNV